MQVVRIVDNVVIEIIPREARPVDVWYNAQFAAQCMEVPDEVQQNWTYDPVSGTFHAPSPQAEPEAPSAEQAIWDEMAAAYKEGVQEA